MHACYNYFQIKMATSRVNISETQPHTGGTCLRQQSRVNSAKLIVLVCGGLKRETRTSGQSMFCL